MKLEAHHLAGLVLALVAASPAAGQGWCQGPTAEVVVSHIDREAEDRATDDRLVHFTLANHSASPLTFFALGEGSELEMRIMDENLPREILAPAGWRAFVWYENEGLHMRIVWEAKHAGAAVAPGATLAGFGLRLPRIASRATPSIGMDGRPDAPLNMATAPFTARLGSDACVWGRIGPQPEGAAPGALHAGFYGGRASGQAIASAPMAAVRVEVSRQPGSEPGSDRAVSFTVENGSEGDVEMLAVGDREVPEMQVLDENIPKAILAPPGWSGVVSFEPDLMHMRVVWRATDPSQQIEPGEKLEGFGLVLPPMPSWQEPPFFWPGKKPAEALDMTRAPFVVQLAGAGAAWGRVEPAPGDERSAGESGGAYGAQ